MLFSLLVVFSFSCCCWGLPMPADQLHQQNHSSVTDRKLSNRAPRMLFKNTFAETYFANGSCSSTGGCAEWDLCADPFLWGSPFHLWHMHQIQKKASLLTPASSFCLDLCILATRGCKREGKIILFSTRQSAAASQSRIFSGILWSCPPELPQNSCTCLACT